MHHPYKTPVARTISDGLVHKLRRGVSVSNCDISDTSSEFSEKQINAAESNGRYT